MALALVAVSVPLAEPVWMLVTTKRWYWETRLKSSPDHPVRGYIQVRRGAQNDSEDPQHGLAEGWYVETGFRAYVTDYSNQEWHGALTWWNLDGTVYRQARGDPFEFVESPPWWDGVTDQTAPSIPAWMKDDEQWQRALDAQD